MYVYLSHHHTSKRIISAHVTTAKPSIMEYTWVILRT